MHCRRGAARLTRSRPRPPPTLVRSATRHYSPKPGKQRGNQCLRSRPNSHSQIAIVIRPIFLVKCGPRMGARLAGGGSSADVGRGKLCAKSATSMQSALAQTTQYRPRVVARRSNRRCGREEPMHAAPPLPRGRTHGAGPQVLFQELLLFRGGFPIQRRRHQHRESVVHLVTLPCDTPISCRCICYYAARPLRFQPARHPLTSDRATWAPRLPHV